MTLLDVFILFYFPGPVKHHAVGHRRSNATSRGTEENEVNTIRRMQEATDRQTKAKANSRETDEDA